MRAKYKKNRSARSKRRIARSFLIWGSKHKGRDRYANRGWGL